MVHARGVFAPAVAVGHFVAEHAIGTAKVRFGAAALAAVGDLSVIAVYGHRVGAVIVIVVSVIGVARTVLVRRRLFPAGFASDRAAGVIDDRIDLHDTGIVVSHVTVVVFLV